MMPDEIENMVMHEAPNLFKLGASFVYECLVVIALSLAGTALFILLLGDSTQGYKRSGLLVFLWLILGIYFIWCWAKGGQTLAMQSWRLKLVHQQAGYPVFIARYLLATMSLMLLGLGFLWALTNKKHQYLHDQLLKIALVDLKKQR